MHTSDLHLGKRIHEVSLAEDQRHMLSELVRIACEEKPDLVVIAGDVYDRAVPSEEAVTMFGDFLTELSSKGFETVVIAGNHDSGARLDYCLDLLKSSGVHIAGTFTGRAERLVKEDEYGRLNVWMLPFFKVSEVRNIADTPIESYADAMRWVLEESGVDPGERNLLVSHQFYAGSVGDITVSDSEEQTPDVGGVSCIPPALLDPFDYVALGHLHLPQSVTRPTIRYSGSPLKYSESEARTDKSVTIVEMNGKNDVGIRTVPVVPLRDVRVIRGSLEDLIANAPGADGRDDYVFVRLTDRNQTGVDDLYRAYPNILAVTFELPGSAGTVTGVTPEQMASESVSDLFSRFYREMTGTDLSEYQRKLLDDCLELCGRDVE